MKDKIAFGVHVDKFFVVNFFEHLIYMLWCQSIRYNKSYCNKKMKHKREI